MFVLWQQNFMIYWISINLFWFVIKMNHFLHVLMLYKRYIISLLFVCGKKRPQFLRTGKVDTSEIPGSSKDKILCEDPGLETGFETLNFSSGIESIYYISLILECTNFLHTLMSEIQIGLTINCHKLTFNSPPLTFLMVYKIMVCFTTDASSLNWIHYCVVQSTQWAI